MKTYKSLNFSGMKRSYASKFLFIAFLGTHIPLIGLVLFSFLYPQNQLESGFVIVMILAYTLIAAIFTLYIQNKLLWPIRLADKAMEEFRSSQKIIDLPTNYQDEAGRLMTNIKETLTKIDQQNNELEQHRNKLEKLVKERTEELEKAKEQAEESDRLKSAFLATMSHELRTPLNHILGFSSMMDEDAEKEEMVTYASTIYQSGQNLLTIIEDILNFSMFETSEIKMKETPVDLSQLFLNNKSILEQQVNDAGKSEIEIITKPQKELADAQIKSDEFMINQVLLSLFKNAVKFTHKGFIEFGLYSKSSKNLIFYVKDSGIGIPEGQKEAIFDYFRQLDDTNTREYEGIGLGLSISQKVASVMGARLEVETEPGEGSTFYFILPVEWNKTEESSEVIQEEPQKKQGSYKDKTVLVVEDDEQSRNLMEMKLKRKGINIQTAVDGAKALEYYQKNPDTHLVFMDLKMPIMDGYEATQKIKEINDKASVVALSAYVMKPDRERAFESGCDDFMPKPIHSNQLDRILEKYM